MEQLEGSVFKEKEKLVLLTSWIKKVYINLDKNSQANEFDMVMKGSAGGVLSSLESLAGDNFA